MNRRRNMGALLAVLLACPFAICWAPANDALPVESTAQIQPAESVREARDRAKLLHETIHGTLQVVHRDLFDDEDTFSIPSRSLEDVFEELERGYQIKVRWLIVNTDVLNTDHTPQDDFERDAVKSLAAGNKSFERASDERYQYVGAIQLKSQCLKCHVKRRLSTEPRTAGLSISMPIRKAKATER